MRYAGSSDEEADGTATDQPSSTMVRSKWQSGALGTHGRSVRTAASSGAVPSIRKRNSRGVLPAISAAGDNQGSEPGSRTAAVDAPCTTSYPIAQKVASSVPVIKRHKAAAIVDGKGGDTCENATFTSRSSDVSDLPANRPAAHMSVPDSVVAGCVPPAAGLHTSSVSGHQAYQKPSIINRGKASSFRRQPLLASAQYAAKPFKPPTMRKSS